MGRPPIFNSLPTGFRKPRNVTGERKLLLNLKNLSLIDSSGVGIVVQTYISLKRSGGELKLIAQGRVRDVLRVFRLQLSFPASRTKMMLSRAFSREVTPRRPDSLVDTILDFAGVFYRVGEKVKLTV